MEMMIWVARTRMIEMIQNQINHIQWLGQFWLGRKSWMLSLQCEREQWCRQKRFFIRNFFYLVEVDCATKVSETNQQKAPHGIIPFNARTPEMQV